MISVFLYVCNVVRPVLQGKYHFSLNLSKQGIPLYLTSFSTVLSGKPRTGVARVTSSPCSARASQRETTGSKDTVHFQSLKRCSTFIAYSPYLLFIFKNRTTDPIRIINVVTWNKSRFISTVLSTLPQNLGGLRMKAYPLYISIPGAYIT